MNLSAADSGVTYISSSDCDFVEKDSYVILELLC